MLLKSLQGDSRTPTWSPSQTPATASVTSIRKRARFRALPP
jgi:hypothetical protein